MNGHTTTATLELASGLGESHADENLGARLDALDHEVVARLDAHAAELRALLADEHARRDILEQLLERSKHRERGLTRAIAGLEAAANAQAAELEARTTTTSKPAAKKAASGSNKATWTPSEERITHIWQQFQRYSAEVSKGEPFTQTTLATWMGTNGDGVASDTVRKVMGILRERELIRKTGTTRGGGTLWAPMREAVVDGA